MFILNMYYGDKPVKKIYLGKKLVWYRDPMNSIVESSSNNVVYFYAEKSKAIGSQIFANSFDTSGLTLLKVIINTDNINEFFQDNAMIHLFKVMFGNSFIESNTFTSSSIWLNKILQLKDNIQIKTDNSAITKILKEIQQNSMIEHKYNSMSTMSANYKVLGLFTVSSFSYNDTEFKTFLVLPTDSNTISYQEAVALIQTNKAQPIYGINKSKSLSETSLIIKNNNQLNGNASSHSINFGLLDKYLAIPNISIDDNGHTANGNIILWYPPIGDEVVLFEPDGVIIDINGDILEIQQAFQVNIDTENEILEIF